jgi:hypothetical protein
LVEALTKNPDDAVLNRAISLLAQAEFISVSPGLKNIPMATPTNIPIATPTEVRLDKLLSTLQVENQAR